jgi:hypothetical protein
MIDGRWLEWPALLAWLVPVGGVVLAAALGLWWWRRTAMHRLVRRTLESCTLEVLRHAVIPDGVDGHIHLDHLLLTPRGLIVLDVRDVRGAVFGAEKMDDWAVLDGRRRHLFKNPLGPLHDRLVAVRALAGEVEVHGRIAFTPRAHFPKGLPTLSVPLSALAAELERLGGALGTEVQPQVAEAWARLKSVASVTER